jgi:glycosyltransferase involved in cell wall biosynthesis
LDRSLSVLLPVRNTQSTLAAQVEQILDLLPDMTSRFEVIIIDDGSTDATIEVADELASRYPQVRAIRHGVPRGPEAALQTGLEQSVGEVICLKDDAAGLPIDEVTRLWRGMHKSMPLAGPITRLSPQRALAGQPEPTAKSGFRMVRRSNACFPAAQSKETLRSESALPERISRPGRPNFLVRLRDFALGE